MTYSTLQWLAPDLLRAGLLFKEDWIEQNCERAVKLYPNQGLHVAATIFATASKHAIDYLEQAPVIALALSQGGKLHRQSDRHFAARMARHAVDGSPRLKDVLSAFHLLPQHRRLSSFALSPSKWKAVERLATVAPSVLAQAIPDTPTAQRYWLNAVSDWVERCLRRANNQVLHLDWAVSAMGRENPGKGRQWNASTVADFVINRPDSFNERWTWQAALARAEEWHDELARLSGEQRFITQFGIGWEQPIDYGALPTFIQVDETSVTALRSGADLYAEGRAMRHCVASYTASVVNGNCRIYSVRKDGRRLATVELSRNPDTGRWYAPQIKGPCNSAPSAAALAAANKLVAEANFANPKRPQ